jgi:hypothetical protein
MEIPGVGQYVAFMETEGNRVSMLQPLPRGQREVHSEKIAQRKDVQSKPKSQSARKTS